MCGEGRICTGGCWWIVFTCVWITKVDVWWVAAQGIKSVQCAAQVDVGKVEVGSVIAYVVMEGRW